METNSSESPQPQVLVDEVIYEILSWLPVKSLVRFKSVCKSWKSLISNLNFIKLHLHRSAINPCLILTSWDKPLALSCSVHSLLQNPSSLILPDQELQLGNTDSVGVSCNGLVSLIHYSSLDDLNVIRFSLWNPVIGFESQYSPSLAFSNQCLEFKKVEFGFGYDDFTDTYKVIVVLTDTKAKAEISERTEVSVYSLGDDHWRRIPSFPIFPIPQGQDRKCVNGSFNWLALRDYNSDYEWDNVAIHQLLVVSLDLSQETYKQFALPTGFYEIPSVEPNVGVFMGCLCFSHDYKRSHFVLWQMKEFGIEMSWTRLVNVSYLNLGIDLECFMMIPIIPLSLSENGDVLILASYKQGDAILYNRKRSTVEWTGSEIGIRWIVTQEYVQSLVSPH